MTRSLRRPKQVSLVVRGGRATRTGQPPKAVVDMLHQLEAGAPGGKAGRDDSNCERPAESVPGAPRTQRTLPEDTSHVSKVHRHYDSGRPLVPGQSRGLTAWDLERSLRHDDRGWKVRLDDPPAPGNTVRCARTGGQVGVVAGSTWPPWPVLPLSTNSGLCCRAPGEVRAHRATGRAAQPDPRRVDHALPP